MGLLQSGSFARPATPNIKACQSSTESLLYTFLQEEGGRQIAFMGNDKTSHAKAINSISGRSSITCRCQPVPTRLALTVSIRVFAPPFCSKTFEAHYFHCPPSASMQPQDTPLVSNDIQQLPFRSKLLMEPHGAQLITLVHHESDCTHVRVAAQLRALLKAY